MADPFLSMPGNEIRSEHLARRVEIQFQRGAGHLDGLPWGEDLDETLLRYGMPENRVRAMGADFVYDLKRYYLGPPLGGADLLTHYTMPGLDLLPPAEGLQPGKGTWDEVDRWPRAGYHLAAGDSLGQWLPPLVHQAAVFRRGEAAVVVAAFDLAAHGFSADTPANAGLALVPLEDPLPEPAVTRIDGIIGPVPLVLFVVPRPALMSLELVLPAENRLARARKELDITPFQTGAVGISDVLLVDGSGELPDSLREALAAVRGSNRAHPGEAVGLFWEMYGLDPMRDPQVSMALRIVAEEAGIVRRLGQILGIVRDDNPSQIGWEEETLPGPVMARSIALTIPDLPGGTHTLELTMEVDGFEPFVARKEIVIGPPTIRDLPDGAMTRRPLLRRTLCGPLADGFVAGNEGAFREALQEFRLDAWMDRPTDIPQTMDCFEWVRLRPEYFGHGAEDR